MAVAKYFQRNETNTSNTTNYLKDDNKRLQIMDVTLLIDWLIDYIIDSGNEAADCLAKGGASEATVPPSVPYLFWALHHS